MTKGVTFYFMRHAETYFNQLERVQGWCDALLTKKGEFDANCSGKGLRDVLFSAVYTSDLQRTVRTAEIILKHNLASPKTLEIEQRPEFREQFFGSFEGLDVPSVWEKITDYLENKRENGKESSVKDSVKQEMDAFHAIDPTGEAEDFLTFWLRVESGLIDLIQRHRETNQNILVVSHGLTIRNMIHELVPEVSLDEPIDNASVSIVRYQDGLYHLEAFNQTNHFER